MNLRSIISKLIPQKVKDNIYIKNQKKIFLDGYNSFLHTGQTSSESYMALINLYCRTNGDFNEQFNDKIKLTNPSAKTASELSGIIGNYSSNDFDKVNIELNKNGYVHFDKKLSKELCERLNSFALKTSAKIPPAYDEKIIYDAANPKAEIYRFDMQDLINNADIQQMMMDPALLNIARNYLGCEPIFDFPAMWWSTAFKKEASSEAAQLYHFDMDRVKWIKIFFYLNDVTLENGPHSYIQGTHKANSKPSEMLKKGYARIKDEELCPYYKGEDVKIISAEAGSIFAGDTKCWHKGLNLKKGHRLVLEFEYTSSLFGVNIPKLEITNSGKDFKEFCSKNKIFASNILFKNAL